MVERQIRSFRLITISHEKHYSDGSGVEYGVRMKGAGVAHHSQPVIEFESVQTVEFPLSELDWLIECLEDFKRSAPLKHKETEDEADA